MTTPGDTRRAQRKAARKQEKEAKRGAELTPIELAIERKLRELARNEAPPERDARAIALIVVRHWGDDAPRVMQMATEFTRDEVGRWAPATPQNSTPGGSRRRGEGDPP